MSVQPFTPDPQPVDELVIPTSEANTGTRPEDGRQDVDQAPGFVEEEVDNGDESLADPAVDMVV